jgi:hypothetical protein
MVRACSDSSKHDHIPASTFPMNRRRLSDAKPPRVIASIRGQGMAETPKRIRRLLREYAAAAHEEELRRALLPVAEAFKRWERRELDSSELSTLKWPLP